MKKKLLSTLFVLLILYAFMTVIAHAAESGTCGADGANVTWVLDDEGTLTISGEGDMKDYSEDYYPPWYDNRNTINEVIINNGVTKIGNKSFQYCKGLKSVIIPDSVTSLGSYVFEKCSELTSIAIPKSIISIGDYSFRNCDNLECVYISDIASYLNINFGPNSNPMEYANELYLNNEVIHSINIPDSVTKIPDYAFRGCRNLTDIIIPDSVTSIGDSAFADCNRLSSAIIPGSVINIGDSAFANCNGLKNILIEDGVTNIENNAFALCGLTSLIIPNSVVSIGSSAFDCCYSLETLILPDNDGLSIGNATFQRCGLKSITIPGNCLLGSSFCYCTQLTSLTICDGVTDISKDAFRGCTNLISITLPRSINEINYQAFRNCGIEDVYYAGSKSEWNGIYIGDGNESIKNANKHYGRLDYINAEITKEETDTAYTFTVMPETAYENCFVYAAIYDADGVLLGVNCVPLQMTGSTSVSVDKQENGVTAKVFVWSNFMQSIIEQAEEFPLT